MEKYNPLAKVFVFGVRKNKKTTRHKHESYNPNDINFMDNYEKYMIEGNFLQNYLIFKEKQ